MLARGAVLLLIKQVLSVRITEGLRTSKRLKAELVLVDLDQTREPAFGHSRPG
jgi:hypothetical protein